MTITQTSRRHHHHDTQLSRAAGPLSDSQTRCDTQPSDAVRSLSPATSTRSKPTTAPSQGTNLDDSHAFCDTQENTAVVNPFPPARSFSIPKGQTLAGSTSGSQQANDTHGRPASGTPSDDSHSPFDTQNRDAVVTLSPAAISTTIPSAPTRRGPILFNSYLCLLADSLDDLEVLRKATDNRVRSLTRTETDSDGKLRGLGLDARSPEVARSIMLAEGIRKLEKDAILDLQREFRKTPFNAWRKRNVGVGEKQAARLLACIGDPYWNDMDDRPRTVSELWSYCGYGGDRDGQIDRRRKGVKSNWNAKAKMRAHLMAEKCMMQKGKGGYRNVYDAAREHYADAVHPHDCPQCGPAGKPALAGSPLSAGHRHARALRRVAKTILEDLWIESREIHEGAA